MKKYILMIMLTSLMFAQISDDMGSEAEVESVDLSSVDCTLEANPETFAELKEESTNLTFQVKFWYSEGYQYYKKYKGEKDPEKLKTYSEQMEKNFWKVVLNDPTGTVKTRMKSRGEVARVVLAMEKLADMYIDNNNTEMLKEIVSRGLENFPDEEKIQKFAATYYKANSDDACAVGHFEKWYSLYPEDEVENRIKILETILSTYITLNQKDLAIEACDRILVLDPENDKVKQIKVDLIGNPELAFKLAYEEMQKDPKNVKKIKEAARWAIVIDNLKVADELYTKLSDMEPNVAEYREQIVKINIEAEKFDKVIQYGKNLNDTRSLESVITAYIAKGKFKEAFNKATQVQNSNSSDGHYLKGYVFEKTASAASNDAEFSKKQYEWRLLYRLAYIEYGDGGSKGRERAKRVMPLIPNKGDIFLKNKRIKPETGKFSNWVTWLSSYDKEVYSVAN